MLRPATQYGVDVVPHINLFPIRYSKIGLKKGSVLKQNPGWLSQQVKTYYLPKSQSFSGAEKIGFFTTLKNHYSNHKTTGLIRFLSAPADVGFGGLPHYAADREWNYHEWSNHYQHPSQHRPMGTRPSVHHFEHVAREGIRLTNTFVASPGNSPSWAGLLYGLICRQTREAGNQAGTFLPTYTEGLEKAGCHMGMTGKDWGASTTPPARLALHTKYFPRNIGTMIMPPIPRVFWHRRYLTYPTRSLASG
jgi:hypothetical protein